MQEGIEALWPLFITQKANLDEALFLIKLFAGELLSARLMRDAKKFFGPVG